ncbi:MAG: response regulator transcription factor [Oscillospiraceae bacterium]|nr:response regulator transcription factor [Oscillospiraceae bacterium]
MTSERIYTVVVADDFRISRSFFELYIGQAARYRLVKSFHTAQETVDWCLKNDVDLLILDVLMREGIDGLTAAQQIKEAKPEISIILVTSTAEADWEKRAQEIGVDGFWYKEYSETSLLELMDEVMAGKTVFPGQTPQLNLGNASREQFTERELDVLRELTQGKSNEEIAQALGISLNGVKFHIKNLLEKTGFSNRLMLVVHANACGIVSGRSVIRKEN